jgi:PAS domain S-box-containing protein
MGQDSRYLGIGTKITVMVCALVVVTSCAVGFFTIWRFNDALVDRELDKVSSLAGMASVRFLAGVNTVRADALVLADVPVMKSLVRAPDAGGVDPVDHWTEEQMRNRVATAFMAMMRAKPGYSKIWLIGVANGGKEIVSVDRWGKGGEIRLAPDAELHSVGHRTFVQQAFQAPRGSVYLSEIDFEYRGNEIVSPHSPVIRAAVPVYTPSNKLYGIVVINRRIAPMLDEIRQKLDPSQQLYMTNDRGDFLLHPNATRAFGFEFGKSYRIQDEFPVLKPAFEADVADDVSVVEQSGGGERRALGLCKASFDPDRPERFFTFALAVPYDDIVAESVQARNLSLAVALAVLLPALVIGYALSRTLAKPLQQIAAAANAFGQGTTDVALPLDANDEAGVVARALDHMMGQIRARAEQLETEIAVRERAEQTAREQGARIQSIVDSVVDAIITINGDGTVESLNAAAEKMFGYTADEVQGQNVKMLMPSPYRGEHDQYLRNYQETGIAKIIGIGREVMAIRKDGTVFPIDLAVSQVKIGGRRLFTGVIRDITRRKLAERQLTEAHDELAKRAADIERFNERLARSNEELKQFAYVASHDLQEPLRKVTSFCQMLRDEHRDRLDEGARQYIDYAVDGALRMRNLVNDLLTYSRVETQGKPLIPTESQSAYAEAEDNLELAIQEAGASVECEPLPVINADRAQLVRLFQNLVANAIKFRGDAPARVDVWAEELADEWIFHVRDNGIGIESQYHGRIFVIFQRLHARDAYPGTGIGLAVCKRIVDRLGGRIWVESEPGQGSTFCFAVPKLAPANSISQNEDQNDESNCVEQLAHAD